MKNILFVVLVLLIANNSFSQKTKTVDVCSRPADVVASYHYNSNNELENISIHFMGQDQRYTQIVAIITLFNGTPKEYYTFLCELEKFNLENETGTRLFLTVNMLVLLILVVLGMLILQKKMVMGIIIIFQKALQN